MSVKSIGVIGAGTMGIGVTVDLILHDIEVVLVDVSEEVLERAKKEILGAIRFAPVLKKNAPKLSKEQALVKIKFTTDISEVSKCDFIVENATEDWKVKEAIYKRLDEVCASDVCFSANTSCISVTKIGAATKRPDKIIGLHFMNPVFLKQTVEGIRGYHTSDRTIEKAKEMLGSLEKEMILVNDLPGFVSNRISHLFMNEAAFVVQDQVATPRQVDDIFKKCYGHTMGPLETADLIGLDTVVDSLKVLYESYQDPKFRCCPLLQKMVNAGLLGKKSGKGFYDYSDEY